MLCYYQIILKILFGDDFWYKSTNLHKIDRQKMSFKLEGIKPELWKTLCLCSYHDKLSFDNDNWCQNGPILAELYYDQIIVITLICFFSAKKKYVRKIDIHRVILKLGGTQPNRYHPILLFFRQYTIILQQHYYMKLFYYNTIAKVLFGLFLIQKHKCT